MLKLIVRLGLSSVVWGAIGLLSAAQAQIVRDTTLPTNSEILTTGNDATIRGGTQVGGNLFHSFERFSVPTNGSAFFDNASTVQNIISRVTGALPSSIDGTIRANGNANLFLINPNGISFGTNAQLRIGGSLVASTANGLQFGDRGFFNATNPNFPSPLLTINPSALLFNQIKPAPIQNNSIADAGLDQVGRSGYFGLRVEDRRSLLLVGGDINQDRGGLVAFGGRIDLGAVAGTGTIGLSFDGENPRLSFPNNIPKANISLTNGAGLLVASDGGGNIRLIGRNILVDASSINAGILSGVNTSVSEVGDITLDATESITLNEKNSLVLNTINPGGSGRSGNININTGALNITGGAQIQTSVKGQGFSGTIKIDADSIAIDGEGEINFPSGVFSTVEANRVGTGGNIIITTNALSLTNGGSILSNTRGEGNAGNINIDVQGKFFLDGEGIGQGSARSSVTTGVDAGANGKGGDLTVKAQMLSATRGARLNANTNGKGNAGNVNITVQDQFLINGTTRNGSFSGAFSVINELGEGRGGNVTVNAGSVLMANGARISASTLGTGNAGNVDITVRDLFALDGRDPVVGRPTGAFSIVSLRAKKGDGGNIRVTARNLRITNGAALSTETEGLGNAGNLFVNVTENTSLTGGYIQSGLDRASANGNGGSVSLTTRSLQLSQGGQIIVSTSGQGNAGTLVINADSIKFDGKDNRGFSSGAFSNVEPGGIGKGGDLRILTNTLTLTNNAIVLADTRAQGQAGNVTIDARDRIVVDSSTISVASQGSSQAGNLTLTTPNLALKNQGMISAASAAIDGGNVTLNIRDLLLLRRNSNISASAGINQGAGNGGNIVLNAQKGLLLALPSEDSNINADAFTGKGGNVQISVQGIYGIEPRSGQTNLSDITASSQFGISGNVALNTPDVDPSRGTIELPATVLDRSNQIAQTCAPQKVVASSFVNSGRGSLPPSPLDTLQGESGTFELASVETSPNRENRSDRISSLPTDPLIEAQGWVKDAQGKVTLVANANTPTSYPPTLGRCQ